MTDARFESGDPHGGWNVRLEGLVAVYTAARLGDVRATLAQAEQAAAAGRWVAVMVAYEAASAFDSALATRPRQRDDPPLVWVGVYERGHAGTSAATRAAAPPPPAGSSWPTFEPDVDSRRFAASVEAVRDHIRDGDVYQVNLTFPMRATDMAGGDNYFDAMRDAQRAPYCARIDIGSHEICSFSPELFFERHQGRVTVRPMKGTAPRGRWRAEDDRLAHELSTSVKDRAENVMIVDLLRNDLSRVAEIGSVKVASLFEIERYPTVWQMTSTVAGRVRDEVTLVDLLTALFPPGSVTGAPKVRATGIIASLEDRPRGIYTGTLGYIEPGGDCVFNVAIRTVVRARGTGQATLGVGAGITIDSDPAQEYRESLLKAAFTIRAAGHRSFALLETMRLEDGRVVRLDRHLRRMADSAAYFGFRWDESEVRRALTTWSTRRPHGCWRLRLTVDEAGRPALTDRVHASDQPVWTVALASDPVDGSDPFLSNKTTNRVVYESARARRPDVDDVLLWNDRGEITESTTANVAVELDGALVTPPVTSGLLAGTFRSELLEHGWISERVITRADLGRATRIWLFNSLRGWIEARVED